MPASTAKTHEILHLQTGRGLPAFLPMLAVSEWGHNAFLRVLANEGPLPKCNPPSIVGIRDQIAYASFRRTLPNHAVAVLVLLVLVVEADEEEEVEIVVVVVVVLLLLLLLLPW